MNLKSAFVKNILILALCYSPEAVIADTYKYLNEKGTVCMTNDINSVPVKFRKNMTTLKEPGTKIKVLDDEEFEAVYAKDVPINTDKPVTSKPLDQDSGFKRLYLKIGLSVGVYALLAIASFCFLYKYLNRRKAGKAALFLLSGILAVYLMRTYAVEGQKRYNRVKKQISDFQKKIEKKSEEKAKIMKELAEISKDNK